MQDKKNKDMTVNGIVVEALPNTFFLVKRDDNEGDVMAYLAGKMRLNHIRVMVGDKVSVLIDPYGGKGRIVKRI